MDVGEGREQDAEASSQAPRNDEYYIRRASISLRIAPHGVMSLRAQRGNLISRSPVEALSHYAKF